LGVGSATVEASEQSQTGSGIRASTVEPHRCSHWHNLYA